jgi:hypothetical protein
MTLLSDQAASVLTQLSAGTRSYSSSALILQLARSDINNVCMSRHQLSLMCSPHPLHALARWRRGATAAIATAATTLGINDPVSCEGSDDVFEVPKSMVYSTVAAAAGYAGLR